jgi:hypothetical protein
MKSELLAQSPMLALPMVALFLFLALFLGIFVVTMKKRAPSYDPVARLPLDGDEEPGNDEGGRR